jgi:NAD dependent epimerase/dehydratase family enzyme
LAGLTRWFLGGAVGTGRQYISWIHLDDVTRLFLWAIENERAEGLYNATSPNPVTNAEFMRELRRVLRRPWSLRTPAPLVRIGSFFMRTEPVLALTGRRSVPARLQREGFKFLYPTLPEALRDVFKTPAAAAP